MTKTTEQKPIWTDKYWDILNQFYWSPKYLGLSSIPKNKITFKDGHALVPIEYVNPDGPLYRRTIKYDELEKNARRQEELFNDIFDLTFSIVPGEVVAKILGALAGTNPDISYEFIGHEILERFGLPKNANIAQHDGFFVSESHTLAVELKFNASTSLDQLAKYCYFLMKEEQLRGRELDSRLLYILNKEALTTLTTQLTISPDDIDGEQAEMIINGCRNKTVALYLWSNLADFRNFLDRLLVVGQTWADLEIQLTSFTSTLNDSLGDVTLCKLLGGLAFEIRNHPLSNYSALKSK